MTRRVNVTDRLDKLAARTRADASIVALECS
jgi:hypothetical protein